MNTTNTERINKTIRIHPELNRLLSLKAVNDRRPQSDVIEEALKIHLGLADLVIAE